MPSNVLITGANRGIGLAITRLYLDRGDRVFACARRPERAVDLQSLAASHPQQLTILSLDVSDADSIRMAGEAVRSHTDTIDILINNAGINPPEEDQTLDYIDFTTLLHVWRTNAAGPLIVVQHFLALLRRSEQAKIINLTSEMGSIEQTNGCGYYAYSSSKAALNMISRILSNDLVPYQIIAVPVDPGWVQTDMGGPGAVLTPEESAAGVARLIDRLTLADSGKYWVWDGSQHEW